MIPEETEMWMENQKNALKCLLAEGYDIKNMINDIGIFEIMQ